MTQDNVVERAKDETHYKIGFAKKNLVDYNEQAYVTKREGVLALCVEQLLAIVEAQEWNPNMDELEKWKEIYSSRSDWQSYPSPYPASVIKTPKGEDSYFIVLLKNGNVRSYERWAIPTKKDSFYEGEWELMAYIEVATHQEAQDILKEVTHWKPLPLPPITEDKT